MVSGRQIKLLQLAALYQGCESKGLKKNRTVFRSAKKTALVDKVPLALRYVEELLKHTLGMSRYRKVRLWLEPKAS